MSPVTVIRVRLRRTLGSDPDYQVPVLGCHLPRPIVDIETEDHVGPHQVNCYPRPQIQDIIEINLLGTGIV